MWRYYFVGTKDTCILYMIIVGQIKQTLMVGIYYISLTTLCANLDTSYKLVDLEYAELVQILYVLYVGLPDMIPYFSSNLYLNLGHCYLLLCFLLDFTITIYTYFELPGNCMGPFQQHMVFVLTYFIEVATFNACVFQELNIERITKFFTLYFDDEPLLLFKGISIIPHSHLSHLVISRKTSML